MEIIDRLKAETPVFFKKIRTIAISLSAASLSASTFYSQLPSGFTDLIPKAVISTIAVSGVVFAFIAQCAKSDKPVTQETEKA